MSRVKSSSCTRESGLTCVCLSNVRSKCADCTYVAGHEDRTHRDYHPRVLARRQTQNINFCMCSHDTREGGREGGWEEGREGDLFQSYSLDHMPPSISPVDVLRPPKTMSSKYSRFSLQPRCQATPAHALEDLRSFGLHAYVTDQL